jgi:hypothetical protein
MRKTQLAGVVAVIAVFGGVVYFASDRTPQPKDAAPPPAVDVPAAEPAKPAVTSPLPASRSNAASRPVPADPRLAALMVSPHDDLIEFFAAPDGKVIKEVDNDPNSASYRMALREYTYAGDKVVRLVSYKHLGGQTQIIEANVTYKADGSVDQYEESTRYEPGK